MNKALVAGSVKKHFRARTQGHERILETWNKLHYNRAVKLCNFLKLSNKTQMNLLRLCHL